MRVPSGHSRVLGEEHRESVVKKNISVSKSDTFGLNTSQVLLFPRDSTAEISETALEEDFSSGRRDAFEKDGKINTTRTLTNCLRFNKRLDMNFLVRKVQEVDILNPLCVSILKIYEACDALLSFFFFGFCSSEKGTWRPVLSLFASRNTLRHKTSQKQQLLPSPFLPCVSRDTRSDTNKATTTTTTTHQEELTLTLSRERANNVESVRRSQSGARVALSLVSNVQTFGRGEKFPLKIVRKVKSGESDDAGVDQRSARGGAETVRKIR